MQNNNSSFRHTFGVEAFQEPFNRNAALYMQENLGNHMDNPVKKKKAEGKIKKLLDNSLGQACISVTYKKSKKSLNRKTGRWFSNTPCAMQSMSRLIRHTLCKGLWIDFDFVNCHPTILLSLCKRLNVEHKNLERYVQHREAFLQEMVDVGGVSDREKAKKLVLVAMNGGRVNGQAHTQHWEELCSEFAVIACAIANHADFQKFKLHAEKQYAPRGHPNMNAKIMSSVLCDLENQCLECVFKSLQEDGCILNGQCLLMFDGLMVADTPEIRAKVTDPNFLGTISSKLEELRGSRLEIKVKDFDKALELPDNYGEVVATQQDVVVIEQGHDTRAVDAFYQRHKDDFITSRGHFFWYDDGIYKAGNEIVRKHVLHALQSMNIVAQGSEKLLPYSSNARHLHECTRLIMMDTRFEQEGFLDKLWESNLGYLAFKDGIYSFDNKTFTPFSEARGRLNAFFTHKINRNFPVNVPKKAMDELRSRVINQIFKKKEQRHYFLHCLARALAGKVEDKRWHVCMGERDSGKGVISNLLRLSFGCFVQTFNSENLLCNRLVGTGDAAKKQSWMSSLEFKRICYSNELVLGDRACKMDGNMVKRLASGGDEVEVRINYKDEERKRLQCTAFLFCNDFPPVDPTDACETLEVFLFGTKFKSAHEIERVKQTGNCPRHWAPADLSIKGWTKEEHVVDAFIRLVLDAYRGPDRNSPPACVVQDTCMFKGPSNESDEDRIKDIVQHVEQDSSRVFSDHIRMALEESGLRKNATLILCYASHRMGGLCMAVFMHASHSICQVLELSRHSAQKGS
jgi:hypothetical protein